MIRRNHWAVGVTVMPTSERARSARPDSRVFFPTPGSMVCRQRWKPPVRRRRGLRPPTSSWQIACVDAAPVPASAGPADSGFRVAVAVSTRDGDESLGDGTGEHGYERDADDEDDHFHYLAAYRRSFEL